MESVRRERIVKDRGKIVMNLERYADWRRRELG